MQKPSGPLSGIRVLDLTNNVFGPLASMMLGDMGADVIKVETAAGDPTRQSGSRRSPGMGAMFMAVNRNKRSVVLDLKRPASQEALRKLVGSADVFMHNMRADAARRLCIDYASISSENPRMVYAVAAGFSQRGRYPEELDSLLASGAIKQAQGKA